MRKTTAKKSGKTVAAVAPSQTKLTAYASGAVFAMPLGNKHVFVKIHHKHSAEADGKNEGKILFVSNIAYDEAPSLKPIFESLFNSKVEDVEASKEQRIALVSFAGAVDKKLQALTCEKTNKLSLQSSNAQEEEDLVDKWISAYKRIRPTRAALAEAADQAVVDMEEAAAEAAVEQEKLPVVDSDGFTMVVSKKNKSTAAAGGVVVAKKKTKLTATGNKPSKKRSKMVDEDSLKFYKFERKRLRQESQIKLKDQFKLDQQKAERIKLELQQQQS